MADQELRDHAGRLLGRIKTRPDGKLELRDHAGIYKGSYYPKLNETRDKAGLLVGRGNLLTTLLC